MQRLFFCQSPQRVGSGPARPPIARGRVSEAAGAAAGAAAAGGTRLAVGTDAGGVLPAGIDIPGKSARIRCRQPRTAFGQPTVNFMRSDCSTVAFDALGVLRARGPEAVSFLQGQLSNDLTRLGPDHSLLAGYHNPQGRVIALLRVLQLAPDDLLAVLPRELVAQVAARLTKFILRAKVKLADESRQWRIDGVLLNDAGSADATDLAALPAALNSVAHSAGTSFVRVAQQPARWLSVSEGSSAPLTGIAGAAAPETWQRLAIAAGEPQVYAATSEEFVAQMLNLDALGAIAFDKGCYTGQEVIARAHYRGRVKRRMQRFVTRTPRVLRPGDAGALADGRAFRVVDAVSLVDGRCEFLAVAPLIKSESESEAVAADAAAAAERLNAETLPLPYSVPS
jgi:tRNA-modifying protein YgfZ